MTRTRHDLFAKQHLEALLEPAGTVTSSRKIASETREVDVWFIPNPDAKEILESLGILGQMAEQSCIIEPFRNAVQTQESLNCLGKSIDLTEELRRQAKRNKQKLLETAIPRLWILSPTISDQVIQSFGAKKSKDWTTGFYLFPPAFRTGLVAIHQLPVNPQTLWLRLMGRDRVQRQAIDELLALPERNPIKQRTVEHLAILQISLGTVQNISEDERELAMNLTPVYEEWRLKTLQEGRQEGKREGKREGRQEGELALVLRLLTRRFGSIDDRLKIQIEQLPTTLLEDLGEALLDFSSSEDLENWLRSK